ncbi:hypothetical protein C6P96_08540 [Burkholderia multivorans]|uniref:hypothetical protein n=1 Tax=Burkholderia multivorans TaxID=87883 RepID=UPI000D00565D|nr:hypothetical protein [Burkholderia multivorans]PRE65498.1 hypothetical protein C6P95_14460 [Burkholderia multivorans]PRF15255.1 hypothetical protein C6P96_08540 [Burkholderia multivorans]
MIQSYDIQIPPGGTQILEVGAQIFDFLSSGSAFDTIQVLPEFQQGNVTLKLGQGFDAGKVVNRWFVKNPGTTAINGTVVLSTAGFRNFRISGDVNVLDGSKSRSLANVAYCKFNSFPAVASVYNYFQLWNPVGNSNRVVIRSITVSGSLGALSCAIGFTNVMAANAGGQNAFPKLSGGSASAIQARYDSTAGSPNEPEPLYQLAAQANSIAVWQPTEPLVLTPGWGLNVHSFGAGNVVVCGLEWYEEQNT